MSALEELFSRAGASDQDREAWLSERRLGVTATEVAKLAQSAGFEAELRKIKAGIETFSGNKYTEWGRLREPVIQEYARGFGLQAESRVFRSATDPRFLASPDMVGEDFDGNLFLGEIKTSKHDLSPDGEYFARSTYYDQMQWQMFVTGADRCMFMWEQHDDMWPEPMPWGVAWASIDADPVRQAELVEIALRFLEGDVERASLAAWQAEYLDAKADEDAAKQRKQAAQDALAGLFPDGGSVETSLGKVTVSFPKSSTRFDSTAFKSAHGELYKEFQKEVPAGGPRVTVTPVKESSDE